MAEQLERIRDLEASASQLEARCSELKEASAGHEARGREALAELGKAGRAVEKLTVGKAGRRCACCCTLARCAMPV
jgi:hypothetical protein